MALENMRLMLEQLRKSGIAATRDIEERLDCTGPLLTGLEHLSSLVAKMAKYRPRIIVALGEREVRLRSEVEKRDTLYEDFSNRLRHLELGGFQNQEVLDQFAASTKKLRVILRNIQQQRSAVQELHERLVTVDIDGAIRRLHAMQDECRDAKEQLAREAAELDRWP